MFFEIIKSKKGAEMIVKQFFSNLKNFSYLCEKTNSTFQKRIFHSTSYYFRDVVDRREMLKSLPKPDEGTAGEKADEIDLMIKEEHILFPTKDTPDKLFDGVKFKDLPIFNIRSSRNNTVLSLTDSNGSTQLIRSCGIEGFKNTKKGTNIAAQATAITIGKKAYDRGVKTVRVRVKGIGPGRMSSIKGLQMAGLNIISITDNTPVSWNPPRPRKQRKL